MRRQLLLRILQDHKRLPVCIFRVKIAAVGFLKMVRFLVKLFILIFSTTRHQKFWKPSANIQKVSIS